MEVLGEDQCGNVECTIVLLKSKAVRECHDVGLRRCGVCLGAISGGGLCRGYVHCAVSASWVVLNIKMGGGMHAKLIG